MLIFSSIYGVVDGLFVSNVVGDTAFSAVNLILPYVMILAVFGFMFGTGGGALISKTYGEGDIHKGNQYFTMIMETILVFGVVCTLIGYFTIEPMAKLLGANEAMLPYVIEYGKLTACFILFLMVQYAFQSLMVVAQKPMLGFFFTVLAGLVNIFGDFLCVYVLKMGVKGAALATGLSQIVGSLLPVLYIIFSKTNSSPLKFTKPCFEIKPIIKASSNGLSEMVTNVSMSLVNMLFNAQLMKYIGQNGVTAFGIIMYVGFIFTGVYFGFATGIAPIIAYQYGAKNYAELRSLFKKSLWIYLGFSLVLASLSIALARPLASAFIRDNEELLSLSTKALRLYSISYYFAGFNIFISSFFTDLNNGFVSGVVSLARTFVFQIIFIYVLPLILGEIGLWLCITFSEILSNFVSLYFVIKKEKTYHYFRIYVPNDENKQLKNS